VYILAVLVVVLNRLDLSDRDKALSLKFKEEIEKIGKDGKKRKKRAHV
jgi:hypothetical protein